MGVKRPHADVHPSRQTQVPATAKKRKVNPHPHRKLERSDHAINPLKSRIRSLERLLKHKENMPADVRLNHERELASCRWELEEAEGQKKKKDLIGKYHMVRFFDRQKATRKLKQAKRKLELAEAEGVQGDALKAMEQEVKDCGVDINYAQYYPLDQAYSALYPTKGQQKKKKGDDDDEEGTGSQAEADNQKRQGDQDMWNLVEGLTKTRSTKQLDKLRNGVLLKTAAEPKNDDDIAAREKKDDRKKDKKSGKADKAAKAKDTKPAEQEQDDGDESDGGFFE